MTREKMREWLKQHNHIETRGERDFESSYAEGCFDGYEYAEMNFKSRTCENCKHWDYKGWCVNTTTQKFPLQFPTDKDFGCNKFERKG